MNPNFLPSHGQSFCQRRSGRRQVKSPGYVWCGGIDDQRILISAPARPHRRSPLAAAAIAPARAASSWAQHCTYIGSPRFARTTGTSCRRRLCDVGCSRHRDARTSFDDQSTPQTCVSRAACKRIKLNQRNQMKAVLAESGYRPHVGYGQRRFR
jgi:hypothetical protein